MSVDIYSDSVEQKIRAAQETYERHIDVLTVELYYLMQLGTQDIAAIQNLADSQSIPQSEATVAFQYVGTHMAEVLKSDPAKAERYLQLSVTKAAYENHYKALVQSITGTSRS